MFTTLKDRIKTFFSSLFKLEEDWKQAWKWVEVQFAFLAGILTSYAVMYPNDFANVVKLFPEAVRPFVGLAITVLVVYLRVKK